MNNGRVNKRSRQERALVHVQNRVTFWGSFGDQGSEVTVDGNTAIPADKLTAARDEESVLLFRLEVVR